MKIWDENRRVTNPPRREPARWVFFYPCLFIRKRVVYTQCPRGRFFLTKTKMSLITYIKETRAEIKHVSWPTRKQAINYTLIVIGVSIATAIILGLCDSAFSLGLEKLILK